jgi:putative MATE family efflux protein
VTSGIFLEPQAPSVLSHLKDIIRLAIPAILALASQPLLSIGDTAMIGRVGVEALAARAVGMALIGGIYWIFAFLTFGTTTLIGHHYGADDPKSCGATYVNAIWLAVGGGLLVSLCGFFLAPTLFLIMGAETHVAQQGIPYFRLYIAGAPLSFVFFASVGFFRGIQNTKIPMFLAFLMNGLHLLLDFALIYGRLGLPPMGLLGAAIAAWVAQFVGAATSLAVFFLSQSNRTFRPNYWGLSPANFQSLFRLGRDLAIRTGALRLSLIVATGAAARMSATILSAHEIAFQLFLLCSDVMDGLAVAGQALVAKHLGARRNDNAYAMGKVLALCGAVAGLFFAAMLLAGKQAIIGFFTTSPDIMLALGGGVFFLLALYQPLNGVVFVLDGLLIGASDTRFLMRAMVGGAFAIFIPLSWLALKLEWDLIGLWLAVSALMSWRLTTNVYRFASGRWMRFPDK